METKTYQTSRMAEGNTIFPASITIGVSGLTVKFPFLMSGKEITILYNKVSAVKITQPIIGFSDVIIETTWKDSFRIHGYTIAQARVIKNEVLQRI